MQNHITIFGNVGKDPQFTEFKNEDRDDTFVLDFSVATNYKGLGRDKPHWWPCKIRGRYTNEGNSFAEHAYELIKGGSPVVISGRVNNYEVKRDGKEEERLFIEVDQFTLLNRGDKPKADLPPN